jgi:hypothetical protein
VRPQVTASRGCVSIIPVDRRIQAEYSTDALVLD